MATIRKRGDKWQSIIRREGFRPVSKSFTFKRDAEKWARLIEAAMEAGTYIAERETAKPEPTLGQWIETFLSTVTPERRGSRSERFRLGLIARSSLGNLKPSELTAQALCQWRDERLATVKPGTWLRDMSALQGVLAWLSKDKGVTVPREAMAIRKPAQPEGRERILEADELERLLLECGNSKAAWLLPMARLALFTAMRQGELRALDWANVDLAKRTAYLPTTKNGTARTVPLSSEAVAVFKAMPRHLAGPVFGTVTAENVFRAFQSACRRAGIEDFHFHDLRHMAISSLATKLPNVVELSRISGHKDLRMLARYYHTKPEELARKLG